MHVDEAAAIQDGATDEAAAAQDVEADKAPKAPADLIARVAASIKQKQKAEAESKNSSMMDNLVARVLASNRKSKQKEQAAEGLGWSGGGGRMAKYIFEGMTF